MVKTSTGLDENVAGLLCYVCGWLSGFVFILVEQGNMFVRFHAMQSIVVFGAFTVVIFVLRWIPVVGVFFTIILSILAFVLWVMLMVMAYRGKLYKVPWAGNIAERWAG